MTPSPRSGLARLAAPLLAALLALPLSLGAAAPASAETLFNEIGGADRFETSALAAAHILPRSGGTVILATGRDYPDALAAGPVGALLQAPVLLTAGERLSEPVRGVIERHAPARIIVVGSEAAVPASIEAELRDLAPEAEHVRHGGRDRHETAAMLAEHYFPQAREVFVATGWNYPDALSAGAAAAVRGAPVLLGTAEGLGETGWAAMERISPERYWLVGGENVLGRGMPPASLAEQHYERIAGADRFQTNAAVADRFFEEPSGLVLLASGANFPDALVAAPLAGRWQAPLLLSRPECTPAAVAGSADRLLAVQDPDRDPLVAIIGSVVRPEALTKVCAE